MPMSSHDRWVKWYDKKENREHHRLAERERKRKLRLTLLEARGNNCECTGCRFCLPFHTHSEELELHEVDGNRDKHSSRRLTEMLKGIRRYLVYCTGCHQQTPNYCRGYRRKG